MYDTCTFHPRRKHIDNHYSQIYDFIKSTHKTRNDSVKIKKQGNLRDFVQYITTWSGYRSYMTTKQEELSELHGKNNVTDTMIADVDILAKFVKKIQAEWKIEDFELQSIPLDIIFDCFVILSERPLPDSVE
uniref:Putative methyltransferase DDB_G0268948 n=1 Tax=Phallusia mammillata TaxID=59560 RepID=A0A6F9DN57_9ASCI|nr:putative methyltransferase DDB_G0268948 [Phallusia mammillata]